MKLLITGGAGFIGSALIRYVINNGTDTIVNIDKLTYAGNLESLISVSSSHQYVFEKADICDRTRLNEIFASHKPDAVIHLAAESHVDRSIIYPSAFIETNIFGTYNLLEASREYWEKLTGEKRNNFKFLHVSTDEVFGALGHEGYFTEHTAYQPNSPYSASKASSDHLARAWWHTYGLPVLITNCSNNYGPFQFPEKLIPLMILNGISGKQLPIYGNGTNIRDWLYVDDHARALLLAVTKGRAGETYNIGSNNERTNLQIVHAICELLDELSPTQGVKHEKMITFIKDRPGHDFRYAINAHKIERDLGWKPIESFEGGLRKTIVWYLENTEWTTNVTSGVYRDWYDKHYAKNSMAQEISINENALC